MIYLALPSALRALSCSDRTENPLLLVVSPLNALMTDQVTSLRRRGMLAAQIGFSEEGAAIIQGESTFVYGSPEAMLGNEKRRDFLTSSSVIHRVASIVADKVHTVIQWYVPS